jgi:hypothetical protein
MEIIRIVTELKTERNKIDKVIAALKGVASQNGKRGPSHISAAGRRRIAAAQRARWAALKRAKKAA